MQPKEDFISYLWKYQRFISTELYSLKGTPIQVINPGIANTDAGPDFLHAKIKIGEELWSGSVEIHVKSSDWNLHGHTGDPKYQNLILHVVWEEDATIPALANTHTLEVCRLVAPEMLKCYQEMVKPYETIPCEKNLQKGNIDVFIINAWLNRILVERLESKTKAIQRDYLTLQSNISESFYRLMAKAFGQRINEAGFDALSSTIPLKILLRHADNLKDLESMLFGVAGFLNDPQDEYAQDLRTNYIHLKLKYCLKEIPDGLWNFLRLRPANFPTVRIAQFAALFKSTTDFFSLIEQSPSIDHLRKLLSVRASDYWTNHYRFGKTSAPVKKWISKQFFNHLVINVFVPFGFYYKRRVGTASYEWVEEILTNLPPENNKVTRLMEAAGFKNASSSESQALYHLYRSYCAKSKCLSCAIGAASLNNAHL